MRQGEQKGELSWHVLIAKHNWKNSFFCNGPSQLPFSLYKRIPSVLFYQTGTRLPMVGCTGLQFFVVLKSTNFFAGQKYLALCLQSKVAILCKILSPYVRSSVRLRISLGESQPILPGPWIASSLLPCLTLFMAVLCKLWNGKGQKLVDLHWTSHSSHWAIH